MPDMPPPPASSPDTAAVPHEATTALAAYLEGLPEPHILCDDRYRILAANAAYRRRFAPGAALRGRTCHEVSHGFPVPCDQAGESCPLAASRRSGQRERVLHLHHTPRGEAYVDIELTPLKDTSGTARWFIEKMEPLRVAQGEPAAQGLIGRAPAFRAMLSLVARVGPSDAAVMLLGESGTGKELVARAVHDASPRAARPFVVVDCASLTPTLFESELFGHEKGAFTGAGAARAGLVEAAHGGTLFLDEVGDIPLEMQVKLLRLIENGTYRRVGSTALRRSDLRLVSATHRDLAGMVAAGRFREDLFHRLATFPLHLPALRERGEDIGLLSRALLERLAPGRALSLTNAAHARLARHPFPGNVRELRNVLERALLLSDGDVLDEQVVAQALAMGRRGPWPEAEPAGRTETSEAPGEAMTTTGVPLPRVAHRQATQLQALRQALATGTRDREALARRLGISLRTLYRRLAMLEADGPAPAR